MTEESPPLRITQRAPAYSMQELLDKITLEVTAKKTQDMRQLTKLKSALMRYCSYTK